MTEIVFGIALYAMTVYSVVSFQILKLRKDITLSEVTEG